MIEFKYVEGSDEKIHIYKNGKKVKTVYATAVGRETKIGNLLLGALTSYAKPKEKYEIKIERKGKIYTDPVTVWQISEEDVIDIKLLMLRGISSADDIIQKHVEINIVQYIFDKIEGKMQTNGKSEVEGDYNVDVDFYNTLFTFAKVLKFREFKKYGIDVSDDQLYQRRNGLLTTIFQFGKNNSLEYIYSNYKNTIFDLKLKERSSIKRFKLKELILFPGDVYVLDKRNYRFTKNGIEKIPLTLAIPSSGEKVISIKGKETIEWRGHKISTHIVNGKMEIDLNYIEIMEMERNECRKVLRDLIFCWD